VIEKIYRTYLEIKSINNLNEVKKPTGNYSINLVNPIDFQLNKFLYKQIGQKYFWKDRLEWSNKNWIEYVSDEKLSTYVLKNNKEIVGYFELIFHKTKEEVEIAYFGILEDYFGKKLGGYLLSQAIKKAFELNIKRVWLHTCSLDHKNALKNYLSRGMAIFKSEILKTKIA
jgi:ribosomal protein S18 acetylase RimI-like enzyme